jgi:hypothetical protein
MRRADRPSLYIAGQSTLSDSMFLKSVTELDAEFEDVRAAMLGSPVRRLERLAAAAGDEGDRMLVDVGLQVGGRDLRQRARLELGTAVTTERTVSLPLTLGVEDHRQLFPTLECSLEAAWLGPGRTHLALMAQYEPPFGLVGRAVDRALLHRVAEAVAQRFLEAVGGELAARRSRALDGS